ncbi:MAG: hypothetical protein C4584_00630 [Armatimonadetes bacterium]|nr:MAG: hypothetical protein C4584_00630 [Armatimonadota bacterium]
MIKSSGKISFNKTKKASVKDYLESQPDIQQKKSAKNSQRRTEAGKDFYEDLGNNLEDIKERELYLKQLQQKKERPEEDTVYKAHEAAVVSDVQELDKNRQKFENIIKGADKTLFQAKSYFPFDFFPDEVTVDINQVAIINRNFFNTANAYQSISIDDILEVYISTGFFLASLIIIDKARVPTPSEVRSLSKTDAVKARRIIQGLVVAKRQGVDLTSLTGIETEDLIQQLEKLGQAQEG